jgi:hypothetical protein
VDGVRVEPLTSRCKSLAHIASASTCEEKIHHFWFSTRLRSKEAKQTQRLFIFLTAQIADP